MAIRLTTTREAAQLNGLKVCVYGASGAGKTRLTATTGEPTVIISAEAGLLSLRDLDIPVIEVATIADVHDAYRFIAESADARDFRWVCLDSVSEIAEVVLSAEKKLTKDPRQAYGALQEQMSDLLRAFRDLPGRNIYMSAKLDRQKDELTGAMLYQPSMPGQRLGQALPYLFDELFVLRVEKDAEGAPSRWLQTGADLQYVAKDRSGALDQYETPDLSAIAAKILQPTEGN
jgi:AAA domain